MDHLNYIAPRTVSGFMQSDARRRVIMGPFGSGKSSGCVIEITRRAMMQKRGRDGFRRSRWAIVRNTMPQLRDTTMKTWFEWFPDGTIGHWKDGTMDHEWLFWDNQDFMAQIGLGGK